MVREAADGGQWKGITATSVQQNKTNRPQPL